jgi:hypothetical protein
MAGEGERSRVIGYLGHRLRRLLTQQVGWVRVTDECRDRAALRPLPMGGVDLVIDASVFVEGLDTALLTV